jgi:hypothetical protein
MCPSESDLIRYSDGSVHESTRARIRDHLDGCSRCFSVCAELMRGSASGDRAPSLVDRTPRFANGALLGGGRYRIVRAVGAGAMGQVYEAEDLLLPAGARRAREFEEGEWTEGTIIGAGLCTKSCTKRRLLGLHRARQVGCRPRATLRSIGACRGRRYRARRWVVTQNPPPARAYEFKSRLRHRASG